MTVDIANRLVELRKKYGYSQEQLAELLGLSRQAVSKWERAEASPDTDNLIMLSRLYGVSLDELLKTDGEDINYRGNAESGEPKPDYVDISRKGIHVKNDRDEVHVGWDGIYVNSKDGDHVEVGPKGKVVVNGEEYDRDSWRKPFWRRFPFAVVGVIAAILLWYFTGNVIWMLLPIFGVWILSSLVEAILKRDPHRFAYPIVATAAFMFIGFYWGAWHPGWVVFLTIPIYYALFPSRRRYRTDIDDDDDDCDGPGC